MNLMHNWNSLRSRIQLYAAGLAVAACGMVSPVKLGVVSGHSMSPTMRNGQPYLLDRGYYNSHSVRRGDVIVFHYGEDTYIKRVAAVGGDSIYLFKATNEDADDTLLLDWQMPLIRRCAGHSPWTKNMHIVERKVPYGYVYVVGDNWDNSVDSRDYGPVSLADIQGHVLNAPPNTADRLHHLAGNFQAENPS